MSTGRKNKRHSRTKRPFPKKTSSEKAQSPLSPLEREVLKTIENLDRPSLPMNEVLHLLSYLPSPKGDVQSAVLQLVDKGILRKTRKGEFAPSHRHPSFVQGVVSLHSKGFGFLKTEIQREDFFIPPSALAGAQHGDMVEAEVRGKGNFGKFTVRVIKVLKRADLPIVGKITRLPGSGGWVHPDDPQMPGPIRIPESFCKKAQDGDRVLVQLREKHWRSRDLYGTVLRVYGPDSNPEARFKALVAQYRFRERFPKRVMDEAERLNETVEEQEWQRRQDCRDLLTFTIDPETAEDFDDALSLQQLPDGNWRLGVHIADVSWFVLPDSEIDLEARIRGTSVYSSHGYLPMLPERLSSELCSLRPDVDRRAFSVFMTIDPHGEVVRYQLVRSMICSRQRFTYREVQDLLDSTRKQLAGRIPPWNETHLPSVLYFLADLAGSLRQRRFASGGLDLDVPDYFIELDQNDGIVAIRKKDVLESNRIVEECMLAANRCVTEFADRDRGSTPKAFLYRVHGSPEPERLVDYAAFIRSLGLKWPFGETNGILDSGAFNTWLQSYDDHPLRDIIRIHALRAMSKANYSTENIGHYGLGFNNYTHFTSPIRRYPDLIVHRILLAHIEGKERYGKDVLRDLGRVAALSSERELAAMELERASLRARQAEFFSDHVGGTFRGMIVNVLARGVFIEIEQTGASGFLPASGLGSAYFDREEHAFIDAATQRKWKPGHRLIVRVVSADQATGKIDLALEK